MGNSASDIMGIGLWNSFSDQVFGLSAAAGLTMNPASFPVLAFDDNVAFGCKLVGVMTENVQKMYGKRNNKKRSNVLLNTVYHMNGYELSLG